LGEIFAIWGDWLTGKREKTFPLMLKILDAQQCLSVQVHPDDAYAMDHEGKRGKSEAWYILDAAPDARLVYGIDTHGEKLDDIGKAREEGKRSYQKVIAFLAAALFTALVLWIISLIV
jgi:mannose-6-phosphate isomerase